MKVLFIALSLMVTAAQSLKYRNNFLGPSRKSSFVEKSNVEKLTKVIRDDLNSKVDEVVELIATDLERELLKGGLTNFSLLEQGGAREVAAKIKEVVKKTMFNMAKHFFPVVDKWIHDSVQPPVVDNHVYDALVHPLGYGISKQIYDKLKIPGTSTWENDNVGGEEEEEEDDGFSTEALGG